MWKMKKFKDHQIEGVEWMWERVRNRKGVVLSDEMGTGKTLQSLEIIQRVWNSIGKSVLIVAPCTLLHNWEKEMEKFQFPIPARIVRSSDTNVVQLVNAADGEYILIVNYELLQKKKSVFLQTFFDLVVFDEAQRIKNHTTWVSRISRTIDAMCKICVTGTPIQNSLSELWSIAETVRPGYFGDYTMFKAEIEDPLKKSTLKHATELEKRKGASIKKHINELIADIVIRRTKKEIFNEEFKKREGLFVPKRKEYVIYCGFTEEQEAVYNDVLNMDLVKSTVLGRKSPLKSISHLKSVCSHPSLVDKRVTSWHASGKMKVIHRLLFMWRSSNRKIILFSQYKNTLKILERFIDTHVYRIDGDSPIGKREEIFKIFGSKDGMEVLLMSMKVGGVGVNLQKSDTVILFDIDWNPFNEEQAKGRAHRIGQEKEVEVYRLLCKGTIEETIQMIQDVKRTISKGVLDGVSSKKVFDKVDLCKLFHYSHDPTDVTDIDNLVPTEETDL
ncbi:DNA excision repair protein ERCC-6 [Nematocida ausubeli]|nr:DNA excision repair protein ERCC-6 [Nematocida ausubeli]KAI5161222.1 DNA excision repair protein ERCC-6 [Nematocida ausubeli]